MDTREVRLANLQALVATRFGNSVAAFARAIERDYNQTRVLLNPTGPGGRWLGERLARQIEDKLELDPLSLDHPPDQTTHGVREPRGLFDTALSLLHIQRVEGTVTRTEQGYQWERAAPDERYPFPAAWLRARGYQAEHCRLLQLESSAMAPRYQAGDVVLINLQDRAPQHGKVYAVAVAGRTELRRLLQHYAGGWELRADNPSPLEPAQQIPAEAIDQVPIIGRVVWRGGEE